MVRTQKILGIYMLHGLPLTSAAFGLLRPYKETRKGGGRTREEIKQETKKHAQGSDPATQAGFDFIQRVALCCNTTAGATFLIRFSQHLLHLLRHLYGTQELEAPLSAIASVQHSNRADQVAMTKF
jgi:hypothetical protein